jgi:hypothetical protein
MSEKTKMKKKKRWLVLLPSLAAAVLLSFWYVRAHQVEETWLYTTEDYYNLPADSLDVLAVGSQRLQTAFNPASYYNATGLYSYVLAAGCDSLNTTHYVLEEAFRTQHPSVVIVDITPLLTSTRACVVGDHAVVKQDYSDTMGYIFREPGTDEVRSITTYELEETIDLTEREKYFILDIASLCEKNGAEPVFINPPFDQTQSDSDRVAAIGSYIQMKHYTFIDYNSLAASLGYTIGPDGSAYISSTWGAEIVTDDLADQTVEYVQGHQDNDILDERLTQLTQQTIEALFSNNPSVDRLLRYAEKYPVVTALRYTGSSALSLSEEEEILFAKLDLDFQRGSSLYALIDHGNVVQQSSQPFDITYNGWSISLTRRTIVLNEEEEPDTSSPLELLFLYGTSSSTDYFKRFVSAGSGEEDGLWDISCSGWSCSALS